MDRWPVEGVPCLSPQDSRDGLPCLCDPEQYKMGMRNKWLHENEEETVLCDIAALVKGEQSRSADEHGHTSKWLSLLLVITHSTSGFPSKQTLIVINCLHLAAQVQSVPNWVGRMKTGRALE